mmetsp:Transcript_11739/g.28094  ORF Transcript_11739/g.28094 Transcript_11739/m.28094 type:complete len:282 (+) Transcript_11739:65-910(+)
MGLEELGFSASTATCLVWLLRACLPLLLFLIWYVTQPSEPKYDRESLLAARQALEGEAAPEELLTLRLRESKADAPAKPRKPQGRGGGQKTEVSLASHWNRQSSEEAPKQARPGPAEVGEAKAEATSEPREAEHSNLAQLSSLSQERQLLEQLFSYVAFKHQEHPQRVFLPGSRQPPPPRRADTKAKASPALTAKENAAAQVILKALARDSLGLNLGLVAEGLHQMLRSSSADITQETFEALVQCCVDSKNSAVAAHLSAAMEEAGFELRGRLSADTTGAA